MSPKARAQSHERNFKAVNEKGTPAILAAAQTAPSAAPPASTPVSNIHKELSSTFPGLTLPKPLYNIIARQNISRTAAFNIQFSVRVRRKVLIPGTVNTTLSSWERK